MKTASNKITNWILTLTILFFLMGTLCYIPLVVAQTYYVTIDTVNEYSSPFPSVINTTNPVELSGSFRVIGGAGHENQYGICISWGDGSPDTVLRYTDTNNSYPYLTWDPNDPDTKIFNGTYNTNPGEGFSSKGHTYVTPGNFTIIVKLFHQMPQGAESYDATQSVIVTIIIYYNVTFNALGEGGQPLGVANATQMLNVTVGATLYPVPKGELPKTFTNIPSGTTISYAYYSPLASTMEGRRYHWESTSGTGSAAGQTNQSGSFSLTSNSTVTANYKTQFNITFAQSGVGDDYTGTVVIISGVSKPASALPYSDWWDNGFNLSYAYQSPLVTPQVVKRYVWTSTTGGLSTSQSGFIIVSTPGEVTGNYKTQYFLTNLTDPQEVGVIHISHSPPYGDGFYDLNTIVNLTAENPVNISTGSRYRFIYWYGNVTDTSPSTSVIMDSAKTVTAKYLIQYQLTVTSAHNEPYPTKGDHWFDAGSSIKASVTSPADVSGDTGYRCIGWTGTGSVPTSGTTTSVTFTISGPSSITWNWETQYYLTMSINPLGTNNTVSPGSKWYTAGSRVEIEAKPSSGYFFLNWTGTGSGSYSGSSNPVNITMNGPITETANFKLIPTLIVQVTATPSGILTTQSSTITVTVTSDEDGVPVPGAIVELTSDGGSLNVTSGTTDANGRFNASFSSSTPGTYTINATSSKPPDYKTGSGYALVYVAIATYSYDVSASGLGTVYFTRVFLDNVQQAALYSGQTYTVTGLIGAHTISVDFIVEDGSGVRYICSPNTITVLGTGSYVFTYRTQYYLTMSTNHGTVVPGSGWYAAGSTVNISSTAPSPTLSERYLWNSWAGTGNGSYSGVNNSVSITMNAPIRETANWTRQFYLTVVSPYGLAGGSGWYNETSVARAWINTGVAVSGNITYVFVAWTGDASGTDLTSNPIAMDNAKTAVANWTIRSYIITFDKSPRQGVMTVDNVTYSSFPVTVEWVPGSYHTAVVPYMEAGDEGVRYIFSEWEDGSNLTTRTIVAEAPGVTYTAYSSIEYQLAVSSEYGTVQGAGWYELGTVVNFSISPTVVSVEGIPYTFKGWDGSGTGVYYTGSDNPATVTMTGPVKETAIWEAPGYYLKVISEYGSPYGSGWYKKGVVARFGVTTPVDHGNKTVRVFMAWSGDVNTTTPEGTVNMTRTTTVTASWETRHLVTFNTTLPNMMALSIPGVPKTVLPGTQLFAAYYAAGGALTVGPAPSIVPGVEGTRYAFMNWTVDGRVFTQEQNLSLMVDRPYEIASKYGVEYLLIVNAKGVTDPFTATVTISSISSVTRSLSPTSPVLEWLRPELPALYFLSITTPNKIGHGEWAVFREWSGDAQGIARTVSLVISGSKTVNVLFMKVNPVAESIPYSIIAGLITLVVAIIYIMKRKEKKEEKKEEVGAESQESKRGTKRVDVTLGIMVSAVALIVSAVVSVYVATGYGINVNELLDFTNWAVIFVAVEVLVFLVATTIISARTRKWKEERIPPEAI